MTKDERIAHMVCREIADIEDNLIRARITQRRSPNWRSGNGQTIAEIIAGYEHELAEIKKCLPV